MIPIRIQIINNKQKRAAQRVARFFAFRSFFAVLFFIFGIIGKEVNRLIEPLFLVHLSVLL